MLTKKIYESEAEKRKDFWLGVGLWVVLNVVFPLCGFIFSMELNSTGEISGILSTVGRIVFMINPLLITIALVIYFAMTRSQMAFGMLAAFAVAYLLSLYLAVIAGVACFVILSGYRGG